MTDAQAPEPAPDDRPEQAPEPPRAALGDATAATLVFGSSAAVLVVEIVALRLLAPYLGLTLETSTTVIGLALAAIAAGSWAGGLAADRIDPRRSLGPLLAVSGVVIAVTPFAVRAVADPESVGLLYLVAGATIVVPGALLSAVTPMVTKLLLRDLGSTGTIVGRLSGVGTVGAIVGTVLTGFVLISHVRVSVILVSLGLLLVLGAIVVELRVRGPQLGLFGLAGVILAGGLASVAPGGCEVETTYHCASVVNVGTGDQSRVLMLDGLRHSYVRLDDPEHLEFSYTRGYASVIDAMFPAGEPLTSHHLGAGGVTMPRWLESTRPGSTSVVSEIDGGVVRLDRERLGLRTNDDLRVRVEDGRLGMRDVEAGSLDLVVGDAFGGVSVPWHLTTTEMIDEVRRALSDDGIYVLNVIDHETQAFARAEARTLQEAWPHVVAVGWRNLQPGSGPGGGNTVLAASQRPFDAAAIQANLDALQTQWAVFDEDELDRWIGDSPVLTDDYAPVDQLLSPSAS